jgi:phosphoglycerate dehydrogenase-like enzyme
VTILVSIHSGFRMWTIPAEYVDRLRRLFPGDVFRHAQSDAEAEEMIGDAEIAFSSHITPQQLAIAGRLRWVHSPAAGVGNMLYPTMVQRAITMTNGRGTSAENIAEHVLALVLAMFRRLPEALTRQAEHVWAQDELSGPRTIAGSRILIVGLGSIGAAAARRFHALGARVVGVRRNTGAAPVPGVASVHPPESLHDLLPEADAVVIAAPQTGATHSLIGEAELARMKPGACLVNVSRGSLIDEAALDRALRSGRLGGAALDVLRDEPLPAGHAMWDVPNLLITPHIAGFRRDHWEAVIELFADNRRRFAAGEPLLNLVDKAAGY